MHIAIDTTPLESGHKNRGTGTYTRNLIEALQKYESSNLYSFFTRKQNIPKGADLVHFPYFDPFFLTLRTVKGVPVAVTVHDLIPIAYREHFPRGLRGELKWLIQKRLLKNSAAVITDSKSSKIDIHRYVGILNEKIHVVYLASSETGKRVQDKKELLRVKKKFNLPEKFILYVGDVNWNKNVVGLIRGFKEVRERFEGLHLVLVGSAFLNNAIDETKRIAEGIESQHLEVSVKRTGFVGQADLASLYSLASAYIQPSFAEGFGLPILDAMQYGCPVVTSGTSSLGEIAGPALTFDPADIGDMAMKIKRVLNFSPKEEETYVQKAYDWVSKFSWEHVAHQTVSAYNSALAG